MFIKTLEKLNPTSVWFAMWGFRAWMKEFPNAFNVAFDQWQLLFPFTVCISVCKGG